MTKQHNVSSFEKTKSDFSPSCPCKMFRGALVSLREKTKLEGVRGSEC